MPVLNQKSAISIYLFKLFIFILGIPVSASSKKYLIKHPRNEDPFIRLDDEQFSASAPETIFFNYPILFDITMAFLDEYSVSFISGVFEEENEMVLPEYTKITSKSNNLSYYNANYNVLTTIPVCHVEPNDKVKIVVVDTVFKQPTYLNAYTASLGSFVGTDECRAHGADVASVIVAMNPAYKMTILNIGVFPCNGPGYTSSLIGAFNIIIGEAHNHPENTYIVNFSGEGPSSIIVDSAVVAATTLPNVRVHVAAGNSAKNCMLSSPARAAAISKVRSIGSTCEQAPCDFTNYEDSNASPLEQCISVNLPSCFDIISPYFGNSHTLCGTSFSAPIDTGMDVIATFVNPYLDSKEIEIILNEGINKVPLAPNIHFSGVWDILDEAFACPIRVLSRELFPGKLLLPTQALGAKNWYNATSTGMLKSRFCINFEASSENGLIIEARSHEDTNNRLIVYLDVATRRSGSSVRKYVHRLVEVNAGHKTMPSTQETKKRIVTAKFKEFNLNINENGLVLQFSKHAKTGGRQVLLFNYSNALQKYDQVSFSVKNTVTNSYVRNGTRCFYRL